jgi:hypothetical protein
MDHSEMLQLGADALLRNLYDWPQTQRAATGWLHNVNLAAAVFIPIAVGLVFAITAVSKKYLHKKWRASIRRRKRISRSRDKSAVLWADLRR